MEALFRALLAGDTATETLQRWCARHGETAPLVAEHVPGAGLPATPDAATRALLGDLPLGFRYVRLRCGARVLAIAENWYAPGRLTPAINVLLTTTDVPFGRAMAPLGSRRRTLQARVLPAGHDDVIELEAVLDRADGAPVCVVRERITGAAVDFPTG